MTVALTGTSAIKAFEYIESCLDDGNALASSLKELPINSGNCFVFLDREFPEKRLCQFTQGGIASREESIHKLVDFLYQRISEKPSTIAIIEEHLLLEKDHKKLLPPVEVFFRDSRPYYFLRQELLNKKRIEQAIKRADSYMFICAVGVEPDNVDIRSRTGDISSRFIQHFSENVEYIVIGAYDSESFLVWKR